MSYAKLGADSSAVKGTGISQHLTELAQRAFGRSLFPEAQIRGG
jgi:hypothetical protein